MPLKLNTASGGSVTLDPANTASNFTLTVPAQTATVATLTTPSFATTIGVGGATAAASGAGITFPATQSASSDANTLDDYEEGTWTPVLQGSGSNPTVTYASGNTGGRYTKIGNIVTVTFEVRWTALSGGSGSVLIAGLPFARINVDTPDADRCILDSYNNTLSGVQVIASLGKNTTTLEIYLNQSAAVSNTLQISNLLTSGTAFLRATLTYFV